MISTRSTLLAILASLAIPHAALAASAAVIKVSLQDTSTDPSIPAMTLKASETAVKAGEVRFEVTNESKTLVHEMLVVKSGSPESLPYDAKADQLIESKFKSLGEVSELEPGKSGQLTLKLTPGTYLLFCNQVGHFHANMWAKLTVN